MCSLALHDLDGALPSHPTAPQLVVARMFLLEARAALTSDPALAERSAAGAREILEWAKQGPPEGWQTEPMPGELDALVGAMLRRQAFGPRGAVRAGGRVPRPRMLHHVPVPGGVPAPGRPARLTLELIVDPAGRVVRITPVDTVDGYDSTIASAVRQWVFEPTRLDGQPVSVILDVTVPGR